MALGLGVLAVALVAAGCGTETGGGDVRADRAPKLPTRGLPAPLAENIRQANVILDGPGDLLEKKLAALRGHPVVVNQWASWCDPCRFEFPFFVQSAAKHREEIAFVGIDMQDSKDDAREFLEEIPLPFPSIFDPDAGYITSLGGGRSSPTTVFVDKKGEVVQVHEGSYASRDQLEQDIESFLLSKRQKG